MARIYVKVEEKQEYSPFGRPVLSFEHKLAVYGRQSQKEQVTKNKESYYQQAVKLVNIGRELGFTGTDDIIVFIENQGKNGKWVNASGTLRIDQRPGLQRIVDLIENDIVKTVLVWAVDRLFRDETLVQPTTFVQTCKEHQTVILTIDDYFDFNNIKRDDRDRFLILAKAAADFITKTHRKMQDALEQVATRGEYDGRAYPVGFYVPKGAKRYAVYELYAKIVRWIFKRFRELGGRQNLLHSEIAQMEYLFPYPPEGVEFKALKLKPLANGYGITRGGLISLLTNVAYIGWWYYKPQGKSTIVIKNNHPAIIDGVSTDIEGDVVTEEDFWFAYNLLSSITPDGEPIEKEDKPQKLPTHKKKLAPEVPALLEDVITSPQYHVYVFAREGISNAGYTISCNEELLNSGSYLSKYQTSIRVKVLDAIFEERVRFRLRYFQAVDALLDKTSPDQGSVREKSILRHLQAVQQNIKKANVSVDSQIKVAKRKISRLERLLKIAQEAKKEENQDEELDEKTILDWLKDLKRLRKILAELEEKQAQSNASETELKQIATKLTTASQEWDNLTFDQKKGLVRLITNRVMLTQVVEGWLELIVEWSPYMGFDFIDQAFIYQPKGSGKAWTEEESNKLREVYEIADRDSTLRMFPQRSWQGIQAHAQRLGLKRPYTLTNTDLHRHLSYDDKKFIDEHSIEYRPGKNVYWQMFLKQEDDGGQQTSYLAYESMSIYAH